MEKTICYNCGNHFDSEDNNDVCPVCGYIQSLYPQEQISEEDKQDYKDTMDDIYDWWRAER